MNKKYVEVSVGINEYGDEFPQEIIWTTKKKYKINKVLHICEAADGEFDGKRFTVHIGNKERDIYRDSNGWYVEPEKVRKCT